MRRASWKLATLLVLGVGCSSGKSHDTQTVVSVWSDLAVPKEIDAVKVEVRGATEASTPTVFPATDGNGTAPIVQFTLEPTGEALTYDLYVTGLHGQSAVVAQEAQAYAVSGQRNAFGIFLGRSCVSNPCSKGQTTCWNGRCLDIAQTPQPYDPNSPAKPQPPSPGPDAGTDASDASTIIDASDAEVRADVVTVVDQGTDAVPDAPAADASDAPGDAGEAGNTSSDSSGTGGVTGMGGTAGGGGGNTGGAGGTSTTSPTNCQPVGDPTNGHVTLPSPATPGTSATYSCNLGYALNGASSVKCQADGTWSGAAPTCLRDCGQPPAPSAGTVDKTGTTAGSTATYACPTGYLPASTTIKCQDDGAWSGTAPTCTIVSCPALTQPPDHGTLDVTTTTYQSKAKYGCLTGYALKGAAQLECGATGQWSDAPPTCPPVDCGKPADPTNGSVTPTPDSTYGSTAVYACNKGYALSGGSPRQCQADRSWSGTAPTCEVNCGQSLVLPSHGGATIPASGTWKGATIQYFCYGDLQLYPSTASSATCQADGTWSGTVPSCLCFGSATPGWGTECQHTCSSGAPVTGIKGCAGTCWEAATKCQP